MELTQVKGNTWVAEGMELIPFYKLDERRTPAWGRSGRSWRRPCAPPA